jgi:predicted nucleic acid-binding Zn ribbon protein
MERAGKALAKLKLSSAISPDELVFAAWPAAVGERIATRARPKALVRGSLVVEAEDAVWQKHLFQLRFQILAKLTDLVGGEIVRDLEVRIASALPRRPPQSAVSHGNTVSTDEADSIQDPGMRMVYKRARGVAMKKKATA